MLGFGNRWQYWHYAYSSTWQFLSGIDNEYYATEEMPSLVPLKDTPKSLDLYEAVEI